MSLRTRRRTVTRIYQNSVNRRFVNGSSDKNKAIEQYKELLAKHPHDTVALHGRNGKPMKKFTKLGSSFDAIVEQEEMFPS